MSKNKPDSVKPKWSFNLAFMALLFLIALIVIGRIIHFLFFINQPITQSLNTGAIGTNAGKHFLWKGQSSINIAVKAADVAIINIDPVQKKLVVLSVPNEAYFELPKNFGSWPVGSIYKLGQEESPPIGAKLLKDSLASLLGLPVDDIIIVGGGDANKKATDLITEWRKNSLLSTIGVRDWQTDLTPWESWQMLQILSKTRSDKVTNVDLKQSTITVSKLLPDSSRVLGINGVRLDLFIRDKMEDQNIFQEGYSVAIYNATSHPGLAQRAARIWTNLGGNVIISANLDNLQNKSQVILSSGSQDLLKSNSYLRMAEIFAPECLTSRCQNNDPHLTSSRAQINLVLGEDYYNDQYSR